MKGTKEYSLIAKSSKMICFVLMTLLISYGGSVVYAEDTQDSDEQIETQLQQEINYQLSYQAHVQTYGWQEAVCDGAVAGTTGEVKRLEALTISLGDTGYQGSVEYSTHVSDLGWQDWVSDGELSGTSGRGLRLETIQIQLTGQMAEQYDIYYRVHAEDYGWMYWDKNGGRWSKAMETAGFVGTDGVGTASDYLSRTPTGAYTFGYAFGIHGSLGCLLDYRMITQNSYWIGTMWDSQYNTWQERTSGTSWDEHLIDYSDAYEYAMTFNYNRGPSGGSAFFLHVSNGRPTAGCISVPRNQMIYLMNNIQRGSYIVIVNSENEIFNLS